VSDAFDPAAAFIAQQDAYIEIMKPLFLPDDPFSDDIIKYFASLLRVLGVEDGGWDPYAESRNILHDLNALMQVELPEERFPDIGNTQWRLGLTLYSHVVEMDAPYEVLTNLLRFRLGKGYSPNPFYDFLDKDEQKRFKKNGIARWKKVEIIKTLSKEAKLNVGNMFDEFYRADLRNAVQHSDYILAEDAFRSRNSLSGDKGFKISYEELDQLITKAKAYIGAVFYLDAAARSVWGQHKGRAIPYDPNYKGLMEVLVDDKDMMCGFSVHWPNNSASIYRRTPDGIEMKNCWVDLQHATVALHVDRFAQKESTFSPLVEVGANPVYTPLDGTNIRPAWSE
jgi:hypothetical protein